MSVCEVTMTSPVGNTTMLNWYDDKPVAFAGAAVSLLNFVPSHSKKTAPVLNTTGLVAISTLPFGSSEAGASAQSSCPAATVGKSGAAVHVLVVESNTAL